MDFNVNLNLQHMASASLVRYLLLLETDLVKETVHVYMQCFYFPSGIFRIRKLWMKVEEKLDLLEKDFQLPRIITRGTVKPMVQPIVLDLMEAWKEIIDGIFDDKSCKIIFTDRNFVDNLHWTPLGTVDRKKTAESLLLRYSSSSNYDNNLPLLQRLQLACRYCLQSFVVDIWSRFLSLREKKATVQFSTKHPFLLYWFLTSPKSCPEIQSEKEVVRLRKLRVRFSRSKFILTNLSLSFNCTSFFYFWEKLSEEERDEHSLVFADFRLHKSIPPKRLFNGLVRRNGIFDQNNTLVYCLLSRMNSRAQTQFFKARNNASLILNDLSRSWLRRDLYFPAFDNFSKHLSPEELTQFLDNPK